MRAAWYERTGPAEKVLQVGDLPDPVAGPGEVLVRVAASGINPADVKRRAGWGGMSMAHPRVIPHCDGAGTIEAVGPGVEARRVGERVWLWNAQGGYGTAGRAFGTAAELIALPSEQAVPLPDALSMEEGACLGVPAVTAHRCVMADGPVEGLTVLVQGGAGAVGHMAVQIARIGGARVIATVSGSESAERVRAAGGNPVDRKTEDVVARIRELTGDEGIDRIVEVDFAANMLADASLIRPNGWIAAYSSSSNPRPVLDYYKFQSKGANLRFVQGFNLPAEAREAAQAFIAQHAVDLSICVGLVQGLDEIASAHRGVETGGFGNVVVVPGK